MSHWSRNSAGLSRWDRYYRIKVRALRSAGEIQPSTESLELKRQIVIFESREFEQQNLQKLNYARPSRETQRFGFGMCQLDTSIVLEMIRPRPCCKRTANPSTLSSVPAGEWVGSRGQPLREPLPRLLRAGRSPINCIVWGLPLPSVNNA